MLKGRFAHRGSPELEATLRRMVVVFRFLGWIWMLLLVIVTLSQDELPPRLSNRLRGSRVGNRLGLPHLVHVTQTSYSNVRHRLVPS